MECNRDEALRSKVLAEAKFLQRDYIGAKKFAHKAKQLFPDLDCIDHFMYVLDVHIVAQDKLQTGENNWYGILEVDPSADENTIRKQYRRLALLLHPDKNKAVGAEAAFKFISEAWSILSDKKKKLAYDARCQGKMQLPGGRPPQQKSAPNAASKSGDSSTNASTPPFQRHGQAEKTQPPPPQPEPATAPASTKCFPSPASAQSMPNSAAFWTTCPSCRMLLEYQRVYILKSLCCPVCLRPFTAIEVSAVSGTLLWPLPPKQYGYRVDTFTNGYMSTMGSNDRFPYPHFESSRLGNASMGHPAHTPTPDMPQQEKHEKVDGGRAMRGKLTPEMEKRLEERIMDVQARLNRPFTKAPLRPKQKVMKKSIKESLKAKEVADAKEVTKSLMAKLKGVIEQRLSVEKEKNMKANSVDTFKTNASCVQTDVSIGTHDKENSVRISVTKLNDVDNNHISSKILSEGEKTATTLGKDKNETFQPLEKAKKVEDLILNGDTCKKNARSGVEDILQLDDSLETILQMNTISNSSSTEGFCPLSPSLKVNTEFEENTEFVVVPMDSDIPRVLKDTIIVPDAEFYDFDKDRTEGHFMPGQVWAAYDDDDCMPRYYARVNKIISSRPFKIQIAWLEARSTSDETLALLDSGFSLTCGEFRIGKSISSERVTMFSHMMKFEKGQRGGYSIYPQQGDIWALYKDLENLVANGVKAGFVVVEVLKRFHEEEGVHVCHLEKRDGCNTLFQRKIGEEYCEWIHSSGMRRFSHQIPAYQLTSDQQPGIMESLWELDPVATPLDLIS